MSGYDGEGTGVDFSGSGSEVADSAAPAQAAPQAADPFSLDVVGRASDLGLVGKESNTINWGQLGQNALTAIGGLFSLSAGGPMGVVGAGRAGLSLSSAPSAFSRGGMIEFSAPGAAPGAEFAGMEADRAAIGSPVLDYLGQPMRLVDRPGFQPGPGRALAVATAARAPGATTPAAAGQSPLGGLILAGVAAFALGS